MRSPAAMRLAGVAQAWCRRLCRQVDSIAPLRDQAASLPKADLVALHPRPIQLSRSRASSDAESAGDAIADTGGFAAGLVGGPCPPATCAANDAASSAYSLLARHFGLHATVGPLQRNRLVLELVLQPTCCRTRRHTPPGSAEHIIGCPPNRGKIKFEIRNMTGTSTRNSSKTATTASITTAMRSERLRRLEPPSISDE